MIDLLNIENTFKDETLKRKIERIEIDAFRLMQYYLSDRISLIESQNNIEILSSFQLKSEKELLAYIKPKAIYETYQYSIVKSVAERKALGNRLFKLTSKHKKS